MSTMTGHLEASENALLSGAAIRLSAVAICTAAWAGAAYWLLG